MDDQQKNDIQPVDLALVACHLARDNHIPPNALLHDAYNLLKGAADFLALPEQEKLDAERAAQFSFPDWGKKLSFRQASDLLGYKSDHQALDTALNRWIKRGHDHDGRMKQALKDRNLNSFLIAKLKSLRRLDAESRNTSPDMYVMLRLNDAPLSFDALFRAVNATLSCTKAVLSSAVERMAKEGLLSKDRQKRYRLTPKGKDTLEANISRQQQSSSVPQ